VVVARLIADAATTITGEVLGAAGGARRFTP
jgi:hypothetical protein